MLSPKENFMEIIHGGKPDRFLKQFEFMPQIFSDPFNQTNPFPWVPGGDDVTDYWGITYSYPLGVPASFPKHGPGITVLEDVTEWKDRVKAPPLDYPEEVWQVAEKEYAAWNKDDYLVGPSMFSGLFDMTHHLMDVENALISLYTEPEAMHELIEFICDWEIAYIEKVCRRLHPNVVLQHDDWGSSRSTFMSPEMFEEFFLEPYKRMYKSFRDNGVEVIIHHADCYAATLVPYMIEIGVDVWQGGTVLNNIPSLVKQYGGQISFMTGIDSSEVDMPNWTHDMVAKAVRKACTECGTKYFIPCQTNGSAHSIFEGVYETIDEEIDKMSAEMF